MAESMITVEVVFAQAERQELLSMEVPAGTSARQLVLHSPMSEMFPDLDLAGCPLGIFGKALANPDAYIVQAGERVEIYRPLIADPKEVRKQRAAKAAQARAAEQAE